jgi:VanZ family protein
MIEARAQAVSSLEIAWYWGIVAAWMAIISLLSSDAFSATNTHHYIAPLLRFLFPGLSQAGFLKAHTVVRKTAHFTEFFVLGLLVFWALRRGRMPLWRAAWMLQALAIAAAYALLDEFHQAFTASRTSALGDSGVDFLGAAASQVVVYTFRYWPRGKDPRGGT